MDKLLDSNLFIQEFELERHRFSLSQSRMEEKWEAQDISLR